MELSDLNVFKAVADTGGIIRAAENLHRVPSNVTARIQKLEEEIGKPLFIREKNRLQISAAGKQLLAYANQILGLAQQAIDDLQDIRPKGVLRIGAMEAVAATRLVEPLKQYHQLHADVTLEVKTAPTGELIEQVLDGKLDMAFVADPAKDPRLVIKPAFKETLVMVSDTHHEQIKSVKDLKKEPTILGFSDRCAYRSRLTLWLKSQGHIARAMEINSYHTLLSCVAAGMGVGMVPEKLLEDYPFADSIRVHNLPAKWNKTVTALIWRKDSVTPCMEAFAKVVLADK